MAGMELEKYRCLANQLITDHYRCAVCLNHYLLGIYFHGQAPQGPKKTADPPLPVLQER